MGLISKSFITKQAPIAYTTGRVGYTGPAQGAQADEAYLRYYSEVSWLRAAISVIAESVAQNTWRLFRKKKDGSREEIKGQHELKDLINHPNPLQSGHDLIELHQIFIELIGRDYWAKEKDGGKKELWIVPPQFVTAIADAKRGIAGYKFERGEIVRNFKLDEIISFIEPDPLNPLIGGSGRAKAAGIDIENLSFMSQYNRNFFYWGADAGTVITYPVEASITPADLDRLNEQWNAGHRSYGRAHRAAILTQGAKIEREGLGQRDMDFVNLAGYAQKSVMGVFGVSYSIIGGTETVNRANAEAQLLNFARWVTTPRLTKLRERLNMSVTPDYGADLELDYDNPVPEDLAEEALRTDNHVRAGVMSLEEARQQLNLGEIDETHHFLVPISTQIITGEDVMAGYQAPPSMPFFSLKMFDTPAAKDAYWRAYVKQAENYEPKMIKALVKMFDLQKAEVLENVRNAVDRNHKLINLVEARNSYTKVVTPILTEVITQAVKQGQELINPETPHTEMKANPNQRALEWLRTRMGWAAVTISQETENILSAILQAGFEQGLGIDQIARQIRDSLAFSDVRAQRIARTEILSANSQGALEGYKDSGVVSKVEFYTAKDERTCEYCMNYHEEVFTLGEEIPIPLHPN